MLQEQEANPQLRVTETISHITWRPSSGTVNGLNFEVARTKQAVSHALYTPLYHGIFRGTPVFVADMQSCNDPDPASLHWKNKDEMGIDVQVSEEQSKDLEMNHASEVVGYELF